MIVQAIYIEEQLQQYCVFDSQDADATPLACFLTEEECNNWIDSHAN